MKTLYIECSMGAAGDMLTAALLQLHPDPQGFIERFGSIGLENVNMTASKAVRSGITGTQMTVTVGGAEEGEQHEHDRGNEHIHEHEHTHEHEHGHEHAHAALSHIYGIIEKLKVSDFVKKNAMEVYSLIAEAEGKAHGVDVGQVHFHEVGAMDAVADITAVCMLMEELAPEKVLVSPVCVGFGRVWTAHGLLPVPAPATAELLRGVPIYAGSIEGELCTPTGAALLRHFAADFCEMPQLRVEAVGYGMGKKEFAAVNCVRAFLGETDAEGEIIELCCNVDDMTPEAVGFAQERLFEAGALDVYTTPVYMKKNRPGLLIGVICGRDRRDGLIRQLFLHTATLGVREYACKRHVLDRREYTKETPFGAVRIKRAEGFGVRREKPEYEDIADIAREHGISLAEAAKKAGV